MGKFAFDPDLASEAASSVAVNGFSSDFSKPSDDSGGGATDGFLSAAQTLGATRLWSPVNLSNGDVNASANTMEDLLNTGTYATAGSSTSRFGAGNDVEIKASGLTANSLSKVLFVKAGAGGSSNETTNHVANNLQPTATTGTWFFVMLMNPLLSIVANKSYGLKFFYFRDGVSGGGYSGKYSLFRHSFNSGEEDQIKLDTAIGLGGTVSSETSAGVPGPTGYVTISTNQVLSVAYINNGSGAEHYFQRTNYGGSYPEASATVGSPSGVENFENSVLAMGNYFQAAQFDGAGCMAAVFFPTALNTTQLGTLHAAIS